MLLQKLFTPVFERKKTIAYNIQKLKKTGEIIILFKKFQCFRKTNCIVKKIFLTPGGGRRVVTQNLKEIIGLGFHRA